MSQAPIARADTGTDPYRWLENRDAEDVLAYLKAENAYLEEQLADQAELREALFQEIKSRIRETDLSLPSRGAVAVLPAHHRRRRVSPALPLPAPLDGSLTVDESAEQLLLDPNELAGGGFAACLQRQPGPQQARLQPRPRGRRDLPAVRQGPGQRRGHRAALRQLRRQHDLGQRQPDPVLWRADDTHRPHKIYRHCLGDTDSSEVYHDPDGRFFVHCYRASSDRQLVILSRQDHQRSLVLSADQPEGSWTCLAPRQEDHEYFPDHGLYEGQWRWLIRSNQAGINFALYHASETEPGREHWQELVPHDDAVMLEDVSLNAEAIT